MQFRCPNCLQPIRVENDAEVVPEGDTIDTIECPSCHSRFNLSADEESTAVVALGMTIAQFEVQEVLGEGSFGTVFKAWDRELQRHVALKVPREGRITRETSKQFLREARAAAGISHPNVVAVYEMGQYGESFYIASELIDGITLNEYLRQHSFEPAEAARLMIQVLSGVRVFHEKGLIHRDLKPGNILLDMHNQPHIADFGLARSEDLADVTVTNSGQIIGTLLYMSPEQARGDNRNLSGRSDIYATGVILYELLTGQKPFKSSSSRTLLHSILTDDARPPRALNKSVPRDLETICLKAMEKEPARRYASAADMADDLQRFLDNRPILARPVSLPERLWRLASRHPVGSVLTVALFLMAAALTWNMLKGDQVVTVQAEPIVQIVEAPPLTHPVRLSYSLSGNRVPPDSLANWTLYPIQRLTGEPDKDKAVSFSRQAAVELEMSPGTWLIVVDVPGFGFHEVYRYVPEDPTVKLKPPYPHERWELADDGRVLPTPVMVRSTEDAVQGMVSVPAGQFEMGGGREDWPAHQKSVDAFLVDPKETTAEEFEQFLPLGADYSLPKGNFPVCIHWNAAVAYAESRGKRLLKEHEFEYLARDLGQAAYPTGDLPAISPQESWPYLTAGEPASDKVRSLPVFGMHSNVAEWTDSLLISYPGALDPGLEAAIYMNRNGARVVRGGPVTLGANDRSQNKWDQPAMYRAGWNVQTSDTEIGFRCARSVKPRSIPVVETGSESDPVSQTNKQAK